MMKLSQQNVYLELLSSVCFRFVVVCGTLHTAAAQSKLIAHTGDDVDGGGGGDGDGDNGKDDDSDDGDNNDHDHGDDDDVYATSKTCRITQKTTSLNAMPSSSGIINTIISSSCYSCCCCLSHWQHFL
jgi:hypothetical protein